ncbi:hypothetical protein PAMP_020905 [Pampus punctatissimus]
MSGIQYLVCLCTLLMTQSGFVYSEFQFIERYEGDSVVFPCAVQQRHPSPFSVYLKRSWVNPGDVLFKLTKEEYNVHNDHDKKRIRVSGDPSSHSLNVTISELTVNDTDRYYCEFVVNNPVSEDERIPGKTEFVLIVSADAPESADSWLVETCAEDSVVLPCLPAYEDGLAVEGVILKRQRSGAPVEVLYNSKHHHHSKRFLLTSVPGPSSITYNLTLQHLQPEDSGMYSCQLLQHGRPDRNTSLGRRVFFVSVQGAQCFCSSSTTLLYALSAAVVILLLLLLLLLGFVGICKFRRSERPRPQVSVYEEMHAFSQKRVPHHQDVEYENKNCFVKKSCPENHYESPTGNLWPRNES